MNAFFSGGLAGGKSLYLPITSLRRETLHLSPPSDGDRCNYLHFFQERQHDAVELLRLLHADHVRGSRDDLQSRVG